MLQRSILGGDVAIAAPLYKLSSNKTFPLVGRLPRKPQAGPVAPGMIVGTFVENRLHPECASWVCWECEERRENAEEIDCVDTFPGLN